MAEVLPLTTNANENPVNLGITGSENGPQQQTKHTNLGGIDEATLTPDMRKAYESMYGDYTRKTQELSERQKGFEKLETEWKTERQKLEQQFKDLNDRYTKEYQVWQQWAPFLQQINKPEILQQIQALVSGKPQGKSPTETAASKLFDVNDDDVIDGRTLNKLIVQMRESLTNEWQDQVGKMIQASEARLGKATQDWVQNYHQLADQLYDLNLGQRYGLMPKEGVEYDPMKVIETAAKHGLQDLRLAYKLAYGDQEMQRATALAQKLNEEERKKIEQEAYERAKREFDVRRINEEAGLLSTDGAPLPRFEKKATGGYGEAEKTLTTALLGLARR